MQTLVGTPFDFDSVAKLFPGDDWLEMGELFEGKAGRPAVTVVEGSVELESFAPGTGPWALLIHGDLHVSGDLRLSTGDYKTSMLVVRGNVRCRNLLFTNGANVFVLGDLTASGVVVGRYGDESARLDVAGTLKARAVVLDHVTGVEAGTLDALVDSAEGWGLPRDFTKGLEGVVDPALLGEEEGLTAAKVWEHVSQGKDLFLTGGEARLRAAREP